MEILRERVRNEWEREQARMESNERVSETDRTISFWLCDISIYTPSIMAVPRTKARTHTHTLLGPVNTFFTLSITPPQARIPFSLC